MKKYPKVVATSVIRSSQRGESHGGVYIVDLDSEDSQKVIDWEKENISWRGRGGDRGLRGIDFYEKKIIFAASDEIFIYDNKFRKIKSISNKYIKDCHEICIYENCLYITSTRYDSIICYDLKKGSFKYGYCFRNSFTKYIFDKIYTFSKRANKIGLIGSSLKKRLEYSEGKYFYRGGYFFDPRGEKGPEAKDTLHINNVWVNEEGVYVSGVSMRYVVVLEDGGLKKVGILPSGTHNARPIGGDKIIANNTRSEEIVLMNLDGVILEKYKIPRYEEGKLRNNNIPKDHARQAFGRGLCVLGGNTIIGGSSPATVSIYERGESYPKKSINITMDVRNSIHGLEVWPF